MTTCTTAASGGEDWGSPISLEGLATVLGQLRVAVPSFVGSLHADGGAINLRAVRDRYVSLPTLVSAAAAFAGCDHLGLLLAQAWSLPTRADRFTTWAADLAASRNDFRAHISLSSHGAMVSSAGSSTPKAGYVPMDQGMESAAVIADWELMLMARLLKALGGPDWRPELVELPRRPPRDCRPYKRAFDCALSFNAGFATIHFDAGFGEWRSACTVASARREGAALTRRIAEELALCLFHGEDGSAERVAQKLGMCSRTMQRQLELSQVSFRAIADRVRFSTAKRLLRDTDMELTQLALTLGYADISVLTRAFTRWAGVSPSSWRAGRRSAHDSASEAQFGGSIPRCAGAR